MKWNELSEDQQNWIVKTIADRLDNGRDKAYTARKLCSYVRPKFKKEFGFLPKLDAAKIRNTIIPIIKQAGYILRDLRRGVIYVLLDSSITLIL